MDLKRILVTLWPITFVLCMILDPKELSLNKYYIASTNLSKNKASDGKLEETGYKYLQLNLNGKQLTLCFRIYNWLGYFMNSDTEIYDPGISPSRLEFKFVEGYVEDHLNSSFVDGFLDVDTFYGIIYLENSLYHIEKINKFPELSVVKDDQSLIYERRFVKIGSFYDFIRNRNKVLSKGNICTLHIFMDESFTKKICNSDIKYCVSLTVSSVKRVNSIFRSTDFNNDGFPDNIGFKIKRISSNSTKNVPKFKEKMINSNIYLESFALNPDLKDVCLGIAFTAQSFKNNVVGVSFAALPYNFYGGGICSKYYNALVITYFHGNHKIVRQDLNDIALAHELGHSFGSFHDTKQENYLMSPKSTGVLKPTSFTFSKRSRENIYSVLKSNGYCFENSMGHYCGNGIVEGKEECDCGSTYNCLLTDKCCTFNIYSGCSVNREGGFKCHPSQGLCCSLSCNIRDISHLGLSCENFQSKCAPKKKSCGIDGACFNNKCVSNECARIHLPECICKKNNKKSLCYTCCNINGKCLSAIDATKLVLKMNITSLGSIFKNPNFSKMNADILQTFCVGKKCKKLGFKHFRKGDYCLINGNLGKCNNDFVCYAQHQNFRNIPLQNRSPSIHIHTSSYLLLILLCNKFYS